VDNKFEYDVPVVEQIEGFYVVRDDLLEYGSKIRFADSFIRDIPQNEIVYGSSPRWGYAQISLAYLCKKYNKKFTLFIAKSAEPHEYTQRALDLDANVFLVDPGYLAVTQKRASDYYHDDLDNRYMLKMGLTHPTIHDTIVSEARRIDIIPDHIWTASSSGTLHRGLSDAFPNAEIHAVSVGHEMTEAELGRAIQHKTKYKFQQVPKKAELPPFPCATHYEGKVWQVMKDYYKDNAKPEKVLMWNVGR